VSATPLLPDRLRALWADADAGKIDRAAAAATQERWLDELRAEWRAALLTDGETDLRKSLIREVAAYENADPSSVERAFDGALDALRVEWERHVKRVDRESVERYYDESRGVIYELMDWHSVRDDTSPLAYVLALHVARERNVRSCLDFGSGVGSGALLFGRAGIDVALADISSAMLDFCRWRLGQRGREARFIDLKRERLPEASFDMILAMDVFEHLVDPIDAVDTLHAALRPGGLLYARIHAEEDADRPQHIARDFAPTFARMGELGLVEVWSDGWLWGHQLFERKR
jgi:SAM-dependent methyltransferase